MSALLDLASFSFHDASLTGASSQDSTIILNVEYYDEKDEEASAIATITGVATILRDGVAVQSFDMETSDGEIYRLARDENEVTLVIFWHQYTPYARVMRTYTMHGPNIRLSAERQ